MVDWSGDLSAAPVVVVSFTRTNSVHPCQLANTPSLVLTPAEMDRQPADAVQGMLRVRRAKLAHRLLVFVHAQSRPTVQARATDTHGFGHASLEPRVDLLQDS